MNFLTVDTFKLYLLLECFLTIPSDISNLHARKKGTQMTLIQALISCSLILKEVGIIWAKYFYLK